MSPVKTEVTCDVCGEKGQIFPAFFFIDREEHWESTGLGNLVRLRLGEPEIRTGSRGYRYGGNIGGDHRGVCLCADHFASLVSACEEWLSRADAPGEQVDTETRRIA